MSAVLVAAAWWILVSPQWPTLQQPPYAIGPYPSPELCRLAGHALMPEADTFKTAEQVAADHERARRAAATLDAAFAKAPRDQAGWATVGSERRHYNAKGIADHWESTTGLRVVMNPPPVPVTGCVRIDPDEQPAR